MGLALGGSFLVEELLGRLEASATVRSPSWGGRRLVTVCVSELRVLGLVGRVGIGERLVDSSSMVSIVRLADIEALAAILVPSSATGPAVVIPALEHRRSDAVKMDLSASSWRARNRAIPV